MSQTGGHRNQKVANNWHEVSIRQNKEGRTSAEQHGTFSS